MNSILVESSRRVTGVARVAPQEGVATTEEALATLHQTVGTHQATKHRFLHTLRQSQLIQLLHQHTKHQLLLTHRLTQATRLLTQGAVVTKRRIPTPTKSQTLQLRLLRN